MTTRIIFTRWRKDDETFRLYTRVNIQFEHEDKLIDSVKKNPDPLISKCKEITIDSLEIYPKENIVYVIDILVLKNGNFEQYKGVLDNTVVESMLNTGLVSGMTPVTLNVWIYGLIISGDYDDGETYRFELVDTGTGIYWAIKMIDGGIYKTVLSIKMENVDEIDIDEYFLEDLEQLWHKSVDHKKKEKEWQKEKEMMISEMEMLRKRTGIELLQKSLKTMKSKIIDYFLPLVNNLLLEKKKLLEHSADEGDTVFLRAFKRKREFDEEEESTFNGNKNVDTNSMDIDEFMEAERRKRIKLADKVDPERTVATKETREFSFDAFNTDADTDEDSIKFTHNRRIIQDAEDKVEKTNDALDEESEPGLIELGKDKESELTILDEDTDADEDNNDINATDISTELESDNELHDTDEDTQI